MTEGNEACDLAPMMVCADMSPGAPGDFGYTGDNVTAAQDRLERQRPHSAPAISSSSSSAAPGANIVRQNLAGAYDQCIDPSGTVTTKPGNNVGPTAQGLNTRFGEYQGGGMNATDFPPDKVTTAPSPQLDTAGDPPYVILRGNGNPQVTDIDQVDFTYEDYAERPRVRTFQLPHRALPSAASSRCRSSTARARSTDTERSRSSGSAASTCCRKSIQRGNENFVFAEYIGDCGADGTPGPEPEPEPGGQPGIYKIVLHNDPLSPDS